MHVKGLAISLVNYRIHIHVLYKAKPLHQEGIKPLSGVSEWR